MSQISTSKIGFLVDPDSQLNEAIHILTAWQVVLANAPGALEALANAWGGAEAACIAVQDVQHRLEAIAARIEALHTAGAAS